MMLDWLRQNLDTIGILTGIISGLVGSILSIWTHFDRRREAREKRRERDPYFRAYVNPVPLEDGWRPLKLVFTSPSGIGFEMQRIEARRPRGMVLGARLSSETSVRDPKRSGRRLTLDWRVDPPRDPTKPASQTVIFCKLPDRVKSASFRIHAREISATRRAFTMDAEATVETRLPE